MGRLRNGFRRISTNGGKRGEDEPPRSFDEALERVRPMAERLIEKLHDMAEQPDEVEVQFGIKLSAEVGAFIASAATEANFNVKLVWAKQNRPDTPS